MLAPEAPGAAPRTVQGLCDDAAAASAWFAALAGEGVAVRCQPVDAPSGRLGDIAPDAWVLHISRGLSAQLARLRGLHAALPRVPLLTVCAGLRDLDHVLALEMGADDVVDAALPAPVVAARLRALWRRCSEQLDEPPQPERLNFGALQLQRRERLTLLSQRPLALTDGEFDVLWLLAVRAGHAVPRADLVRRLRGLDYQRDDRSIDCRVYRIRAKLGDTDPVSRRIRTVRNNGYLFSSLPW
ncbi:MAG: winged helix-turn-helix domain-containing protein [Burkholderiales bacterium]